MTNCSALLGYAGWVCAVFTFGCGDAGPSRSAVQTLDAGSVFDDASVSDDRCVAPDGVASSPHSIADVANLLNALPHPVSLPCFIESLARPLSMQAVDSRLSAQPADGRRSPRVFLFSSGLTVSVVPGGSGSRLLELGEAREADHSLKAELEFPIEKPLDEAAPYERLPYDPTITTCGFCHQGEVRAPDIDSPYAFVSPALRPQPSQRVPLDELRAELRVCDEAIEPDRCALLHALFDPQPAPVDHEFPMTYKTFF